jgi:MYXO-CTERM domain-containing protein
MNMLLLLALPALAVDLTLTPGDDIGSLTASLSPGSVITFSDGLYPVQSTVYWTAPGSEGAPIVLKAAEGATPIIELTGADQNRVVVIQDSAYLRVEGLTFRSSEAAATGNHNALLLQNSTHIELINNDLGPVTREALYLYGNNSEITVQGNEIHETVNGTGIYVGCSDASCQTTNSIIQGNLIWGLEGDYATGIVLSHGSQGIQVTDNVLHDISWGGIYLGSTEYGLENTAMGNAIWNVGDYGMEVEGASTVQNNVIFQSGGEGIDVEDPGRNTYQDIHISSNTIADTVDWGIEISAWAGRTGMVLTNNAISNPTGYGLYADEAGGIDSTVNYIRGNVVTGLVQFFNEDEGHFIAGGGYGDFEDAVAWDFYPSDGSLLINAGDLAAEAYIPASDFNGAPRDGEAPDAGAYEWDGVGNPGWVIQEDFKELGYERAAEAPQVGGCCSDEEEAKAGLWLAPLLILGGGLRRRRR